MKKNMGTVDKSIRIVLAIVMIALALALAIPTALKAIFLLVALIFIVTSLFSCCPLYGPLRIDTRKRRPAGS